MTRLLVLLPLLAALQAGEPVRCFPPDNPWNWDVSGHAVHPDSAAFIASIGADSPLHADWGANPKWGFPIAHVTPRQKKSRVEFRYADESDPGPYPIPDDPPIEGGADSTGDRHVLMVDREARMLYELYKVTKGEKGWKADSGAIWKLDSNDLRREGWTSADAAGLPIYPGLVRLEEVERGVIPHALRFTVRRSRKEYWWPARHHAGHGDDAKLPPMGLRVRLKATFDVGNFPKRMQVVLRALQRHGMLVADNGSDWFVSGTSDPAWKPEELATLAKVKGSDFEVVQTVDAKGKPIPPRRK